VLAPFFFVAALAGAPPAAAQETIEVTVSKTGFRPEALRVRKGETLHLSLKSADGEHCFAVDALRVEKRVRPGRATSFDLTPDKAGSFPIYCCLEPDNQSLRGRLVVSE
jgi:heme/copper-type cytochrome/quinol oxidase subunit 2